MEPPKKKHFRFSKSALTLFQQCPERFKYAYVDQLEDMGGPEAMLGQRIHQMFFDYYNTIDLSSIKSEEDLIKHGQRYDDGLVAVHLRNFLSFNCKMYASLKNKKLIKPIMMEQKMIHPTLNLSGLVDAVFKDDDDNILILDYKTGKFSEYRLMEYRLELAVYDELIRTNTHYVPTHWGIKFSKFGIVWKEPVQPLYFKQIILPLMEMMKKDMANHVYEPKTGPLCLYCPFKKRCSAWGGVK